MRLLFLAARDISNPHAAGGDITMYQVATRLAREGHEVRFICSQYKGAPAVEERDGIEIHRMGSLFATSPKFLFSAWKPLSRWTDVILEEAFGGLRIPYVSALYARRPRICFWYQRNTLLFTTQFGPVFGHAFSLAERMVAMLYRDSIILTPSDESKASLTQLGLPAENIRVYYPGLDDGLLDLPSASPQEREPLIVTLGKFRRYKCLHHAILVMDRLKRRQELNGVRLVIAGRREDLKYERSMVDLIRRLGLEPHVQLETNISEARKAELLRRASLLLITSPLEGFGRTAIEANLFGVPVIATTGVPREVIRDGFNGYRVRFGDVGSFADMAARVLTHEEEARAMGKNGMEFARQFTWNGTMQTVREALKGIAT